MDMGDMKSRDLGNLMSKGLVSMGKEILENGGTFDPADIPQGAIPKTVKGQNLGHNAKKEALGPNTKR